MLNNAVIPSASLAEISFRAKHRELCSESRPISDGWLWRLFGQLCDGAVPVRRFYGCLLEIGSSHIADMTFCCADAELDPNAETEKPILAYSEVSLAAQDVTFVTPASGKVSHFKW